MGRWGRHRGQTTQIDGKSGDASHLDAAGVTLQKKGSGCEYEDAEWGAYVSLHLLEGAQRATSRHPRFVRLPFDFI